jgi:hypothetical protein
MEGISKGGAQITLSPEIKEAKAGRGKVLDYSKNDAYALGCVMGYDVLIWSIVNQNGAKRDGK